MTGQNDAGHRRQEHEELGDENRFLPGVCSGLAEEAGHRQGRPGKNQGHDGQEDQAERIQSQVGAGGGAEIHSGPGGRNRPQLKGRRSQEDRPGERPAAYRPGGPA